MKYLNMDVKVLAAIMAFGMCMISGSANAVIESRALPVDHRVHTITYQPDAVFKYTGHYRYQSSIEFAPDETIKTIAMGDSSAWMMNPSGNRLFIKPVDQDATTNMTLFTNKRTYLFELHARETDDIDDPNMVFVTRFAYPDENAGVQGGLGSGASSASSAGNTQYLDSVPDPDADRTGKYNVNYTISGSDEVAPLKIFDDGEFTFFQFADKNAEVPAFYWVDDYGSESLINYRTRGDYIVVERVSSRFTLRHGPDIVCVFNEKRIAEKAARKKQ